MHVYPSFTVQNRTDSAPRHAVLISKLLLGHSFGSANRSHLILCQLRELVSTAGWTSAFRVHVFDVVGLIPKKQVFRVHASTVVAAMQHLHAFGDWANVDYVGRSMCEIRLISHRNLTIANGENVSGPIPATSEFVSLILLAKRLCIAFGSCGIGTRLGAIATVSLVDPVGRGLKRFTAMFTRTLNEGLGNVTLRGHRSLSLRCRARGVSRTAWLRYFRMYKPILPQPAVS